MLTVDSLDVFSLMDRDRRSMIENTSSESTVRIHGPTLSVPGRSNTMLSHYVGVLSSSVGGETHRDVM